MRSIGKRGFKKLVVLSMDVFVFLIVWAGAKQSRSPGAEQPTQVQVYQLPLGVDGLATLSDFGQN